jgi:hypothetical protein
VAQLLDEARATLSKMPDGPEKTNAVLALMGRGGKVFLDWMSLSKEEVDAIYEKNKASYELSQQQQQRIQEMQRSWNDIRIAVEGLAITLGVAVLPIVEDLTTMIVKDLLPGIREIANWVKGLDLTGLKLVVDVAKAGGPKEYLSKQVTDAITKQWDQTGQQASDAYTDQWNQTQKDNVPATSGTIGDTTTKASTGAGPRTVAAAEALGKVFDTGLANGMTRSAWVARNATAGVVTSAVQGVNAYSVSLDLGKGIAGVVALGIFNNRKVIADSLKLAVMLALLEVQASIGAHSPSTLFADKLGKPMGLGVLQGFEDSLGDLRRSMTVNLQALAAPPGPALAPAGAGNVYNVTIAPRFGAPVSSDVDARYKRVLRDLVHEELVKVIPT